MEKIVTFYFSQMIVKNKFFNFTTFNISEKEAKTVKILNYTLFYYSCCVFKSAKVITPLY